MLGLYEPIQRDADGRVRYHYTILDFLAYYRGGEPQPGDDAAEVRWVEPADLAAYELSPATAEMIGRALAYLHQTGDAPQ